MTFRNARKLHNEDEVTVKKTNIVLTVLDTYIDESGKYVLVECDDGNTYYHDEIRQEGV